MKTLSNCRLKAANQQGAAILVITILLLLVATIGTLMVGRVGLVEQKAVGTDVRSKEVYSAAIGGLEYGVNWFNNLVAANVADLDWTDADGDGTSCAGDTATPDGLGDTSLNADDYAHEVTYTLKNCLDARPIIVNVASVAAAENDSHVQKTVSIDVMIGEINDLFGGTVTDTDPSVFQGPPVMVEGCMSGVTGNPDIYPHAELGIAIGTTRGTVDCINEGHFDTHGGTTQALTPSMDIPEAVFGVNVTSYGDLDNDGDVDLDDKYIADENAVKAKLLIQEARNPDRVFVVDNDYPRYPSDQPSWNGVNWHNTVGSEDEPIILYFAMEVGCPKVNGGPTIHGLVYYAADDCASNGWGATTLYGTVAFRGDMTQHTANANIHGQSLDFGGGGGDGGTNIDPGGIGTDYKFAEIPGSWRDF